MHFQERPWDLYLTEGYAVAMAALILATGQGILAAILLVLFVPGYTLVAAFFPSREDLDWMVRIALSLGLSIALVSLLGLLLNFTFGVSVTPIVLSILVFSGAFGTVAFLRRTRLPVEQRLSATVEIKKPAWRRYSTLDNALTVSLVASVLLAAAVLAYVYVTPRPGERFTEFYILGSGGMAEGYPSNLNVSDEGTFIIGVVNHEFDQVDYTIRVDRVGVQIRWNETGGYNETVELNRTAIALFNISLEHDADWTWVYTFRIDRPGLWQIRLLLFRDGDMDAAYRNLHLIVRVGAS